MRSCIPSPTDPISPSTPTPRPCKLLMDDQVRDDQRRGAWTTARHRATGLRLLKDGQTRRRPGPPGGDPERRGHRVAASDAGLGSGSGRAAERASGAGGRRSAGGGGEPPGPPAAANGLPGAGRADGQHAVPELDHPRRHGTAVPAAAIRAHDHAAVHAGGVRQERSRAGQCRPGVACAAVVVAEVRRTAASVRGDHAVGVQPAAQLAWPCADGRVRIRWPARRSPATTCRPTPIVAPRCAACG